jgi:hypothetical protein
MVYTINMLQLYFTYAPVAIIMLLLAANSRLGWKCLIETNTITYYEHL